MQKQSALLSSPQPFSGLTTSQWFNAPAGFSIEKLRGRVIALHTFQMLCPGCVSHGIPQAQRLELEFDGAPLSVVGLHTVFEHHDVMTPLALHAFLHEYRVTHPVGVDAPGLESPIPQTMARLRLRGTPSLLLIDGQGQLRASHFGRPSDLLIGAQVGSLLNELANQAQDADCTPDGCVVGS